MYDSPPVKPIRRKAIALGLLMVVGGCAGPPQRSGGSGRQAVTPQIDPAKRQEVIMTALSLLETDYRYGGARPVRGFDCSGLVKFVFQAAAQTPLPHNTAAIAGLSQSIRRSRLQPGDLVFFNTLNRSNSHMGIYLGDDTFINAPSTGGRVRIDSLKNPYYARHFESAGTLFAD